MSAKKTTEVETVVVGGVKKVVPAPNLNHVVKLGKDK